MKFCRSNHAFTLIELLVVFCMITLVVAIVLPSLSANRRSARETLCLTQVRGFGQACFAYEADNGTMPSYIPYQEDRKHAGGPMWSAMLIDKGYLGSDRSFEIVCCPLVKADFPGFKGMKRGGASNYGMNAHIGGYLWSQDFPSFTDRSGNTTSGWNPYPGYDTRNSRAKYVLKPFGSDDVPQASRTMLVAERYRPWPFSVAGVGRGAAGIRRAQDTGIPHSHREESATWDVSGVTMQGRTGTNNMFFVDGSGRGVYGTQTADKMEESGFHVDGGVVWDPFH